MKKTAGNSLLFHAINLSNIRDLVALLEDEEADVNCRNINNATPLHFAVNSQNSTIVELLLKFNANPDLKESYDIGYFYSNLKKKFYFI
jgi:ankyrin repeat protein